LFVRAKQQGLYVNLGRNGQVASLPTQITNEQADEEYERAEHYQRCVHGLVDGSHRPFHFEKIAGYFKGLFEKNYFIET
jgi:hypothetical protein